jgi:hypothetical protein
MSGMDPPRMGRRTQPRVSTLGTDHPERCALKERQIERPNLTNKTEVGSNGPIVARLNFALCLCAAIGARFVWYPHLSPLQGEPFILRVPRVSTMG